MGRTIPGSVLDVLRWRAKAQEANLGHRSGIVGHSQIMIESNPNILRVTESGRRGKERNQESLSQKTGGSESLTMRMRGKPLFPHQERLEDM